MLGGARARGREGLWHRRAPDNVYVSVLYRSALAHAFRSSSIHSSTLKHGKELGVACCLCSGSAVDFPTVAPL